MTTFSPSTTTTQLLQTIGDNLRTARIRRRKSLSDAAQMVGVSKSSIERMEKGDPSVKIGVYLAAAEVYQIEDTINFADPAKDTIGQALERQRQPKRIHHKENKKLDF
nr:helix-turn-helix domain-containing protein [Desulfobulbaceae bacterium]